MVDHRFTCHLTAIFRWEIHPWRRIKKALDEGVSDAHFGEKLLGPGRAAGEWTDLESFAGCSSSKAKLNDLSLPVYLGLPIQVTLINTYLIIYIINYILAILGI